MVELPPELIAPGSSPAVDLPIPPASKSGWPWDPRGPGLRPLASGNWPRITIVTPSFNQAEFLEETIRSVLLQDYPNLEYIVIDGGSTDGSVEIIREYERWLSYWVSEPDQGQSHAINRGFSRATGEVIAWLNSDDLLLFGALAAIAQAVLDHPEAVLIYGEANLVRRDSSFMNKNLSRAYDRRWLLEQGNPVPQPSAFIRRRAFSEVRGLDENLHFAMDYDLWFRLGDYGQVVYIEKPLSSMRTYPEAKTSSGDHRFFLEVRQVVERYGGREIPLLFQAWLILIHWRKAVAAYRGRDWAAGQRELGYIIRNVPAWQAPDDLAQRLVDQLWALVLQHEAAEQDVLELGEAISRHLPPEVDSANAVRSRMMSLLSQAAAFSFFRKRNTVGVLRSCWRAVGWDRRCLMNRGLWAISIRSLSRLGASS